MLYEIHGRNVNSLNKQLFDIGNSRSAICCFYPLKENKPSNLRNS